MCVYPLAGSASGSLTSVVVLGYAFMGQSFLRANAATRQEHPCNGIIVVRSALKGLGATEREGGLRRWPVAPAHALIRSASRFTLLPGGRQSYLTCWILPQPPSRVRGSISQPIWRTQSDGICAKSRQRGNSSQRKRAPHYVCVERAKEADGSFCQ